MLKVTIYVINQGQASQYYGLISEEGNVLHYAPNNWKTKAGAIKWAKNHGFEFFE